MEHTDRPVGVSCLSFTGRTSRFKFFNACTKLLLIIFMVPSLISCARRKTDENIVVTSITPTVLAISTAKGNLVASVGPEGVLLVGIPPASSTKKISEILAMRTKSPIRYVVIGPEDLSHSEADAGWGQRGAFVAMHENALHRLGGAMMNRPKPLPDRLVNLGVDRPHVGFSEVLSFDLNGDSIHIVHQKPGYSDADAVVHFHEANLVYLGYAFPGNSYPDIDHAQGGTVEGLLATLQPWTYAEIRVVPQYGDLTNGTSVKSYRDMVMTVRERVQSLIKQRKTEDEILAAHPTADFDARWAHGRVQPGQFVHALFTELTAAK